MLVLVTVILQLASAEPSVALQLVNLGLNFGLGAFMTATYIRIGNLRDRMSAVERYLRERYVDPDGPHIPPGIM